MLQNEELISGHEYHPHYDQMSKLIAKEPLTQTTCHDKACLGVLAMIVGALLGIGIYEIVEYSKIGVFYSPEPSYGGGSSSPTLSVGQHIGIIFAGIAIGLIISYIYVILIRCLPRCMVYTIIIVSLALGVILLVLCIVSKIVALIVISSTMMGIYVIALLCYRK